MLIGGPLLMLFRPKWLYIVTVFFLPFTATAVINIGTGFNTSGLQASMFLGTLLLLRYGASALWRRSLPVPRNGEACIAWLGLFIAVTALSLIMPVWLDSHVRIPSPYIFDTSTTLLHLQSSNITGVLYMVFGYAFAYLTAILNQKTAMVRLTLKSYLAGSAFASIWAIMQLICKATGIAYPGMIFNTSKSPSAVGSALGYLGNYQKSMGIIRISSVSIEPSVLAEVLLVGLCLCLPFVFGNYRLFSRTIDRWICGLLLVALCITTASTAYIGLLVILSTVLCMLIARRLLKLRYLMVPLAGLGLTTLIYRTVPPAQRVLDMALFTKAEGGSALERLMTIHNAFEMFQQHPVLGIGWASIASHDLIANLLGNSGILGLLTFTIAMFSIFRAIYRSIELRDRSLHASSKSLRLASLLQTDFALYVALMVTVVTSITSGFPGVLTFFWFTCGLTIASASRVDTAEATTSQQSSAKRHRICCERKAPFPR